MGCGRKLGPYDCCSVVCGDCLELMKALPDGCVDAVITDPPYGANLGRHLGASDMRARHVLRRAVGYRDYDDSPGNFMQSIIPRVRLAVEKATRALVFCMGSNVSLLPKGDALGGVFVPAACGRSRWGFTCFMPCLLYGTAPMLHLGSRATAIMSSDVAEPNGHPCPKPVSWMLWAVSLASWQGETILDPFLGSGTTAVAALKLGRHFLGFEISPVYAELARQRIALVQAQPTLFERKPEQLKLNPAVEGPLSGSDVVLRDTDGRPPEGFPEREPLASPRNIGLAEYDGLR